MQQDSLKALIIGGGIGGLCLAQGLKKAGIAFEIFERNRNNDSWLEGYRINIAAIGSQALHRCLPANLWDAFLAGAGDPHESLGFMTEQLKDLLVVDADMRVNYTRDPARQEYAAGRRTLRYILQSGLDEHIRYNKVFVRYEHLPGGKVRAVFEDGTTATGDVLIGADGANSKVRQQLLPHAERITTDAVATAGKLMLNGKTRQWLPPALAGRMNVIMPPTKYFFFNAVFDHSQKNANSADQIRTAAMGAGIDPKKFLDSSEDYILWSFIANKREFKRELDDPAADIAASVLTKIEDWHPDFKRLIRESDPSSLSVFPLKAMQPFKNWKPSNVTILGDAAHNMPPVYGMGANMALHDAQILLHQLTRIANRETDLAPALYEFQEKMLKHGFKALKASVGLTRQASGSNIVQRWFSRRWFRLCAAFEPLKKMSFTGRFEDFAV